MLYTGLLLHKETILLSEMFSQTLTVFIFLLFFKVLSDCKALSIRQLKNSKERFHDLLWRYTSNDH